MVKTDSSDFAEQKKKQDGNAFGKSCAGKGTILFWGRVGWGGVGGAGGEGWGGVEEVWG